MAKKVGIEKLGIELQKILDKYNEDLAGHVEDVVYDTSRKAVKAVQEEATAQGIGHGAYAKGWKVKMFKDKLYPRAVLFHSRPGLPHLLEFPHMLRNGKYSKGRPHAAPVENMINEFFESELRMKL